ncbi:MAG: tryptophan synthase subunit alpha [Bacteroidetes bacterium]|nr:tryptophan synthase subunit alpha [Bacteroidota bacterium]
MSNRIDTLFEKKKEGILSVYFTAGYPNLEDTIPILQSLQNAGCDMVEIGMPFSDPLADGPVIQHSSTVALSNGMSIKKLLLQLKDFRKQIHLPVLLMGYMNPVVQYGIDKFCSDASAVGVDGLIIPDMPLDIYQDQYAALFKKYNLHQALLITPRTGEARIHEIEKSSGGFIYAVSSSSTTGSVSADKKKQQDYFERLKSLRLKKPVMIGFGIGNREQFQFACRYAQGGIIGTAFIKHIEQYPNLENSIPQFIQSIRHDHTVNG